VSSSEDPVTVTSFVLRSTLTDSTPATAFSFSLTLALQ
jgi:hypothetical protein